MSTTASALSDPTPISSTTSNRSLRRSTASVRVILFSTTCFRGSFNACLLHAKVAFLSISSFLHNKVTEMLDRLWDSNGVSQGSKVARAQTITISSIWSSGYWRTLTFAMFFLNGPIPASFCLFSFFSHSNSNDKYKLKKHRWCAWDSNPGRQDGRRRRIHWAMAAPHAGILCKGNYQCTAHLLFGWFGISFFII